MLQEGAPIGSLQASQEEARQRILNGEWEAGTERLRHLLEAKARTVPKGVEPDTWTQLCCHAMAHDLSDVPRLVLVESKSLPRSGHHYLKALLNRAHGECFSYCEGYKEPGCCKASPCRVDAYWSYAREHAQHHVRLIKSHDLHLQDSTYPAPKGVVRLIQVRQPLDLLASWLELEQLIVNQKVLKQAGIAVERIYLYHEKALLEAAWRSIDRQGCVMTNRVAKAWIASKVPYVVGFINKWLPLCKPWPEGADLSGGTFLLRYDDLGAVAPILAAIGIGTAASLELERFAPRTNDFRERPSKRVSRLLDEMTVPLLEAERKILASTRAWSHLLRYQLSSL